MLLFIIELLKTQILYDMLIWCLYTLHMVDLPYSSVC